MSRLLTLTCILVLSVPSLVLAQPDPGPDEVGIYFDTEGSNNHDNSPVMYQPNDAYLILTGFTGVGTLGWELTVDFDPGAGGFSSITNWAPHGEWVNADAPPGFAVGLASPLPAAPAIVLMDITYFYTGGECYFSLAPGTVPSIPGRMAALDGADVGHIIPLLTSQGYPDGFVACVNCWIATETSSWGAVKALYR